MLKIYECHKQTQDECKGAKLSDNIMRKFLHKFFKTVVYELKNALPNLL